MEKINFQNNVTKANADTFNTMQDNIENAINSVSSNVNEIINGEVYSTSEVKTNKVWIDNKPIYRKVLKLTGTYYTDQSLTTSLTNIDTIIISGGYAINSGNAVLPIPYSYPTSTNVFATFIDTSNNIALRFGSSYSSSFYIKELAIVLEYTKTTD